MSDAIDPDTPRVSRKQFVRMIEDGIAGSDHSAGSEGFIPLTEHERDALRDVGSTAKQSATGSFEAGCPLRLAGLDPFNQELPRRLWSFAEHYDAAAERDVPALEEFIIEEDHE